MTSDTLLKTLHRLNLKWVRITENVVSPLSVSVELFFLQFCVCIYLLQLLNNICMNVKVTLLFNICLDDLNLRDPADKYYQSNFRRPVTD